MLTPALSYSAAANVLTLTLTAAPAAPTLRLVRQRAGKPDEVLVTQPAATTLLWQPTTDGSYRLRLQSGTQTGSTFTVADQSGVLEYLHVRQHDEAVAREYDEYIRQQRTGTRAYPLTKTETWLAARLEGFYRQAENNSLDADQILNAKKPYPNYAPVR